MHTTDRSRWAVFAGAVALLVVVVGLSTAAASASTRTLAQTCTDSTYGCTPSTPPPSINPTCSMSETGAAAGDVVSATLSNVPVGTHTQLLFDGQDVAEGDATGSGANGSVTLSFTIPASTPPGTHTVVFVGAGFQCDATNGKGLTVGVLSEQFTRAPTSGDTPRSAPSGLGGLARTGIEVALLLAVAIALVLLGSVLVDAARRRHRRAVRRRNRVEDPLDV